MIIKLDMSLINRKIAIIYNGQHFCPQVVIYTSNTIRYLSIIPNRGRTIFTVDLHSDGYFKVSHI